MKVDKQIKGLPDCSNPLCNQKGFIMMNSQPFCGNCVLKVMEKRQKMVLEVLTE